MATYYWTGNAGNGQWTDGNNWDQGFGYPQAGDIAQFYGQTTLNVDCSGLPSNSVLSNLELILSSVNLNNAILDASGNTTTSVTLADTSTLNVYQPSSSDPTLRNGGFSINGNGNGTNSITVNGWNNCSAVAFGSGVAAYLNGDNFSVGVPVSIDASSVYVSPSTSNFPQTNWSLSNSASLTMQNSYAQFAGGTNIQIGGGASVYAGGFTTWDSSIFITWVGDGYFYDAAIAGGYVQQRVGGFVAPGSLASYLDASDPLAVLAGAGLALENGAQSVEAQIAAFNPALTCYLRF